MFKISAFYNVSKIAYLVAFITFCMRAGQFMCLPFLAIYLSKDGLLTPAQIGMVLGISGLTLSLTSLLNGMYLDRTSHKTLMIVSLLLSGICYFAFSFSMQHFLLLLLINAALGWFRSLVDISVLSILVGHTKPENLSSAYSARFIGANLGVILGPLIGALMAIHESLLIFYIAGGINIVLGLGLFYYKEIHHDKEFIKSKSYSAHFKLVIQDKFLMKITLINFLLWAVYSMVDTTLPQSLANTWKNPAALFATLMMINAILCVLFQAAILRWAELTSLKLFGILGSMMFAAAYLIISAQFGTQTSVYLIASVIIMTFGELFTLPINSLLIMRIAPKHLISSYNGLANVGYLGLSVGPVLGGFGLEYIGREWTFLLASLPPILAALLYFKLNNANK